MDTGLAFLAPEHGMDRGLWIGPVQPSEALLTFGAGFVVAADVVWGEGHGWLPDQSGAL